MIKTELLQYREIFENELKNDILDYWMKYAVEQDGDGFYGAVDLQNKPIPGAIKSCVLNSRILWTFSAAALLYRDTAYATIADKAYKVITTYFRDEIYGGYFMGLRADNSIDDDIKHTYAQAFVLYALCKYYEYHPSQETLTLIQEDFKRFEAKTKDKERPGYLEAFTRDWQPLTENRMADHNEPRSMNTHLHVLEAYAALYNVWKDEKVSARLHELLLLFLDKIIRPDGHLGIFFDEGFQEAKVSKGICSFGHDIEASWLLLEAAESLGNQDIVDRMKAVSVGMAEAVEKSGLDKDGGLFLESYRFGSHVRTNKHWWLQAETLVGFMNAFEVTGAPGHWENVKLSWEFIDKHVIDHEMGEWFTKVNRDGRAFLSEPADDPSPYYRNDWKIDPWKCPYHNGRACMELMKRIDKMVRVL